MFKLFMLAALAMRHTREILRLHFESHLAPRQIAKICNVGKSTVQRYLERLKAAGLSWPLPAELDDAMLERRLFPPPPAASPEQRCLPDCAAIHKELKSRKNVTLQLLWEEYRQANPLGYAYSWHCELYREWQRRLDVVLRHAVSNDIIEDTQQSVHLSEIWQIALTVHDNSDDC
jgi:transposase